ncbi:hypothetical protein ACFVWY_10365 [Streptomyces sp. NPDC058195]|uniref:hypothetical protein n=1 Tax=Streptomyces sp. NPDC058195 TaxID=3346375 RepID=UPI0036E99F0E
MILKAGQWNLAQDVVAEQEGKFRDYSEAIKAAGYTVWTGVGEVYMVPLRPE